ncbi:MAG: hypothetical protein ABIQ18_33105 [Umezawaea sp.]
MRAGYGLVKGKPVVAFHTDATLVGGARLADGVESLHGVGRVFATMTRASDWAVLRRTTASRVWRTSSPRPRTKRRPRCGGRPG